MTSTSAESGSPAFRVTVESDERTVVLAATGEIDLMSAPRLEQAAQQAFDDTPSVLVVDLSEVTFLSSAGLSVLVSTEKHAPEESEVRIVAANPATLRPLQLMGLDQNLAIFRTR